MIDTPYSLHTVHLNKKLMCFATSSSFFKSTECMNNNTEMRKITSNINIQHIYEDTSERGFKWSMLG